MKTKITLICALMLTTQNIFCQVSNIVEGSKWKEVRCNYYGSTISGIYNVDNWRIEGDTILNGKQYKKIYNFEQTFRYGILDGLPDDTLVSSTDYFYGGIREEDQNVYMYSHDFGSPDEPLTEKRMFDYSASVGDTISVWCRFYYIDYIVEDIVPTLMMDGSTRNKFILGVPSPGMVDLSFIEGIGSNYGLIGSYIPTTNDQELHLLCFAIDNTAIFESIPVYTSNCLVDPIQELCESVILGVENGSYDNDSISVYPNPTSSTLSVVFDNRYSQSYIYRLFSPTGQSLMSEKVSEHKFNIDLSSFPDGLYYLEITTQDFERIVKKVVKHNY